VSALEYRGILIVAMQDAATGYPTRGKRCVFTNKVHKAKNIQKNQKKKGKEHPDSGAASI
jgi:hypothetical protein